MKTKILSLILAAFMIAGMAAGVAFAEDDAPGIVLPEDPLEPARAAGVVFTEESGMIADSYTGYVSGIDAGAVAGDVLGALENKNGIEIRRGDAVIAESDKVNSGDLVVLAGDDGAVKAEFSIIFMGDADMSSTVNLSDASTMLKYIASWENVEMDEVASDVDGSGAVNLTDVSTVLKKVASWDVEFAAPIIPGRYDMVYKSMAHCYGANPTEGWVPLCLSDGIHYDLGVKFNVAEGEYATKITFLCPSWADDKGQLSISVYKWTGDYNTSIAAMPIVTQTFVDYKDNTTLTLDVTDSSGKGLVEGEYVWRIHDGADAGDGTGVGIWYYSQYAPAEDTGMKTFLNCKEFNIGPVADIYYASEYVKK